MGSKRQPLPSPDFASEEEEMRFWDEHDPSDSIEGPADLIIRLEKHKKRAVTMRIDEPLYQQLRAVAARHGLPYQRLMRGLLRQSLTALLAEEKRLAES
jgi:predicted DNA binding CopG/RHH family protein